MSVLQFTHTLSLKEEEKKILKNAASDLQISMKSIYLIKLKQHTNDWEWVLLC